jgi:hypothetical protein
LAFGGFVTSGPGLKSLRKQLLRSHLEAPPVERLALDDPAGEVSRPGITSSSASLRRSSNPSPSPSSSDSFSSSSTLIDVSHRLRPRDYAVASLLDEHTTLTTDQLTAVLFTSSITCRHRLSVLRSFGFVDRFIRRNEPGVANIVCWVPGPLSARLTALATEQTPPTARALRERQDRVYANPALDHLLESNEFFIRMLTAKRLRTRIEIYDAARDGLPLPPGVRPATRRRSGE